MPCDRVFVTVFECGGDVLLKLGEEQRGDSQTHRCGRGVEEVARKASLDVAHWQSSAEGWPDDALALFSR